MIFSKHILNNYLPKLLFLSLLASTAFAYSGGTGEPNSPYQIGSVSDWNDLMHTSADWSKNFILIADVNLKGVALTPVGDFNSMSGTAFTGVFDGNSHIIRNVDINLPNGNYVGLFGQSLGQIRNLGVEDVNIRGRIEYYNGAEGAGGLAGYSRGIVTGCYATGTVTGSGSKIGGLVGWNSIHGIITDCYSTCKITGNGASVGGLVGQNRGGTITNCYATGPVSGSQLVGGLVGYNNYAFNDAIITGCYATGTVTGGRYIGGLVGIIDTMGQPHTYRGIITNCSATGDVSGGRDSGGLVGANYGGSINNCYSTGDVSGDSNSWPVGGLVGDNLGTISNCYSTGTVSGSQLVGGLVGDNYGGSISNCYSTGDVSGYSYSWPVGGLVGDNLGTISNCYSTGTVSGSFYVGGLVGRDGLGSISNCYSTGAVIGDSNVGGLVGYNYGYGTTDASFWDVNTAGQTTSQGGTGKTTAQMKTLSTFTSAGWDFLGETENGYLDTWRMCVDGVNYPHLRWEYSSHGDFGCPDGTDYYDLFIFTDQWLLEKSSLVNFLDFAVFANSWHGDMTQLSQFASQWLQRSATNADIAPAPGGDGIVNFLDFALFAENWLKGN